MESLTHRMKSIEIVNERLSQPDFGTSDGTIGAVASMVTYEVKLRAMNSMLSVIILNMDIQANNGSPLAIQTHINGLERMINLCGGFQNAKFSAPLQRLIAFKFPTTIRI